MSTGELEKQRPLDDRERAPLLGEEFGLGTLEQVSRDRKFPRHTGWGLLLAPLVAIVAMPVVAGADRFLAPRLVPAMTEAYESGGPVNSGRVRLSQAGITVWPPEDNLFPWAEIKSIHMTYVGGMDYVHEIIVGRTAKPSEEINVSGLPNGIFLPMCSRTPPRGRA
jgi:hypothetical protein